MNCIIIDDEATARAIIKKLCDNTDDLVVRGEFDNALVAMKYLNKNEDIDVVFLDIHMPEFTGFDFIETLPSPPKIVLTTSDKNFAIEAFEYDCIVDYLTKPITQVRFIKAVNKLEELTKNASKGDYDQDFLFVNINKRLIKINFEKIVLIQAKGDYVKIQTEDKNLIVHTTLKNIIAKLPKRLFFQVHRSYIVNLKKIDSIEENTIYIGGTHVKLSKMARPKLMELLNII